MRIIFNTMKVMALAVAAACYMAPANAGVSFDPEYRALTISGVSDQLQVNQAFEAFEEYGDDIDTVFMYGPGGYLFAGLQMGDLIHSKGVTVIVPSNKKCISACAFAALGGENIYLNGEIWFHGPYYQAIPIYIELGEIAPHHVPAYFEIIRYMQRMGYRLLMAEKILADTTYCKFLVTGDDEVLAKMKGPEGTMWLATNDQLCQ